MLPRVVSLVSVSNENPDPLVLLTHFPSAEIPSCLHYCQHLLRICRGPRRHGLDVRIFVILRLCHGHGCRGTDHCRRLRSNLDGGLCVARLPATTVLLEAKAPIASCSWVRAMGVAAQRSGGRGCLHATLQTVRVHLPPDNSTVLSSWGRSDEETNDNTSIRPLKAACPGFGGGGVLSGFTEKPARIKSASLLYLSGLTERVT